MGVLGLAFQRGGHRGAWRTATHPPSPSAVGEALSEFSDDSKAPLNLSVLGIFSAALLFWAVIGFLISRFF